MAACPAVTVWLAGCVEIDGANGTPSPLIAIVATWVIATGAIGTLPVLAGCDVSSVLVIERVPETLPIVDGAKLVVNVALCPGTNVNGSDGPLILIFLADAAISVTVDSEVPEFISVRL